jgi:hypothetical protein
VSETNGFGDVLINNSVVLFGTNFVVFGRNKMSSSLTLFNLDKQQGLSISPAISYDFSGRSVSNAGDVNGDGYDDLIIGVPGASLCYVLFGTVHGWVNMTQGFTVFGSDGDNTGWSVSGAGEHYYIFSIVLE